MKKISVYSRGAVKNAPAAEYALVTGDVTGGSFRKFVSESAAASGGLPLAVELRRAAYRLVPGSRAAELPDFSQPASGVRYSRALCMKYFCGGDSVTAFDDSDTLSKKSAEALSSGASVCVEII